MLLYNFIMEVSLRLQFQKYSEFYAYFSWIVSCHMVLNLSTYRILLYFSEFHTFENTVHPNFFLLDRVDISSFSSYFLQNFAPNPELWIFLLLNFENVLAMTGLDFFFNFYIRVFEWNVFSLKILITVFIFIKIRIRSN